MTHKLFCELADVYDAMVDWPKRLAHEEPFYRPLFERVGARRVLDAACGTGRHAAMFHRWGLEVEAADLSEEMVARARRLHGEGNGLHWTVRSFAEPIEPRELFDAVVCVGNSLALAPDRDVIRQAVRELLAAVREGGVAVVHLLNLWRLPDGPCLWQKCQRINVPDGEVLIVKGVHRCGARGFVDLVVTDAARQPVMQHESAELIGIEAAELEAMARDAGANEITFYGGYRGEPYDREASIDLIAVMSR